jgi:hypothetical protein
MPVDGAGCIWTKALAGPEKRHPIAAASISIGAPL